MSVHERMEALIRRMATMNRTGKSPGYIDWAPDYAEASHILAELDGPSDLDAARRVAEEVAAKVFPPHWGIFADIQESKGLDMARGEHQASCDEMVACALAGIAKGRELERMEADSAT